MKYTTLRAFEKHIEEASPSHFSHLYLVIAKDSFARKEAADRLAGFLLAGQKDPQFCLKTFNAEQQAIEDILMELNSVSMFSTKRVFMIHNAEKYAKGALEKLEPYFLNPSKDTYLILCIASLAVSTTFYKKSEKAGIILDIPEEKPWEKEKTMQAWIAAQALASGKKISPQACQALVKQSGTDQASLHQELEKLICYCGERIEITAQDVAALCTTVNLETIWQLGEAIFRRDVATALRISKGMMEDGTAFLGLLRQIRSQFQTEFQIACILASGGSAAEVTQQFPYMKGNILDRHMQSVRTYGWQKFKDGLLLIDATELQAKNSGADAELLNELLIIKLTA